MNENRPAWATNVVVVTSRVRADVCSCGQDLDICTGNHCPRCGHTLRHHDLVTAAA